MKLLVVQETDWIERNPILHHRMVESLVLSGDEVTVLDHEILWHTKGPRPLFQQRKVSPRVHRFFPESGVTVVRPGMLRVPLLARPSWLAATVVELRNQFSENTPEIVVAYGISNAFLAQRAARLAGVPFVYHVMDALHTLAEQALLRRIAAPVERMVMRNADEVIVINNALAEYARRMGADPNRLHVIPMGVNTAIPPLSPDPAFRLSLGFAEDDVVLMFMGWLYPFSGLMEVIEDLRKDRETNPALKLLIVGDGDLLPDLTRARNDPRLRNRLVLTGRRPAHEMRQFLAAADVCLLPARHTQTMEYIVPAKIVEYMEAGKAVVATRLRGIEAEFGDLDGLLYIHNPHEALDCIREALSGTNPRAVAAALGASCRRFMESRPDWESVTQHFSAILREAECRIKG